MPYSFISYIGPWYDCALHACSSTEKLRTDVPCLLVPPRGTVYDYVLHACSLKWYWVEFALHAWSLKWY